MVRVHRAWMTFVAGTLAWISLVLSGAVRAENSLPLSDAWNITSSGKAGSSGELLFRVTEGADTDPVEVTVFVLSGANETGVASSIRRALSEQLDARQFNVAGGEGANVLLSGSSARRGHGFSVELVDSDVENVRVRVQSVTPVAPPTVPSQQLPSNPPPVKTPAAPGESSPPEGAVVPGVASTPADSPPPQSPPAESAPPRDGSSPPAGGEAGAAASAPPPPANPPN